MENLIITLERNVALSDEHGDYIYNVRQLEGGCSGIWDGFDIEVSGKQAEELAEMLTVQASIYAFPDKRFKSGWRIEQY